MALTNKKIKWGKKIIEIKTLGTQFFGLCLHVYMHSQ